MAVESPSESDTDIPDISCVSAGSGAQLFTAETNDSASIHTDDNSFNLSSEPHVLYIVNIF